MGTEISKRMAALKPSAIREILKVTADPSFISFSAGNPSSELFPVEELASITAEIYEKEATTALQYSVTEGYGPLRELTRERYGKYGIGNDDDDTIIVSGAQQGIDLATKCLVNEGDAVLCENPSFIGALNAFRSYNARLIGVPVDGEGMDTGAVEEALKRDKNIKLIYTIPTFHNPTGTTMSIERRKRLLELAEKYDVMILEDSPYFELAFSGEICPPIKSFDTTGRVIYVGSYSKIVTPGIRVGFVTAPKWLVSKMTVAKQVSDVHTNMMFMMVVAKLLETCDMDKHIENCRLTYSRKCAHMLENMDRLFHKSVTYTRPEGGLFIWADMPEGYGGLGLCDIARRHKVAIVPGTAFDVNESAENRGFRLNFSVPTLEQIEKGIKLVADSIEEYLFG
ncbi:MAG: PLP-dependent aminotransferase family protein [Clostridiales bacterium]|jgi:2-aminoadipate transaminase|nr:PLP-dependent aminotransferase family protein [Clostridiales bacterium]